MSKLVEWVVVKQLMQHINCNNLDNPQSAYKTGHSTENALLHIKNEWYMSKSPTRHLTDINSPTNFAEKTLQYSNNHLHVFVQIKHVFVIQNIDSCVISW